MKCSDEYTTMLMYLKNLVKKIHVVCLLPRLKTSVTRPEIRGGWQVGGAKTGVMTDLFTIQHQLCARASFQGNCVCAFRDQEDRMPALEGSLLWTPPVDLKGGTQPGSQVG